MATFTNGNLARVTHGAYSDRRVNPIARELAEGLLVQRPDLEDHPAAVWSWARSESRCLLIEAWLDQHHFIDAEGKLPPAAQLVNQFEKLAMSLRTRLGLDPQSQAQLQSSRADAAKVTYDLDELRRKGREILERP